MGQNQSTEEQIMEVFYENPEKEFTIRELSKLSKLPRSTIHKYLNQIKKQGLITKDSQSSNSLLFKTKKANFFIEKLIKSGLMDELISKLNPSCIILFGSIRKGDSTKESDIDIFVETSIKKELNLSQYEKKLKHKIQLFKETKLENLQPNLLNNVVNGIKLYGSFKIK